MQAKLLEEHNLVEWLQQHPEQPQAVRDRVLASLAAQEPRNVDARGEELYDYLSELFFLFDDHQLAREYEKLLHRMKESHYYDNVLVHLRVITDLLSIPIPAALDLKRVLLRLNIMASLHMLTDPTPWNTPPAVRTSSRMQEIMPLIKCVVLSFMNATKYPPEEFGLGIYPITVQNPNQAHAFIALLVAYTQAKPMPAQLAQSGTLEQQRAYVDEQLNNVNFLIQPELYRDQVHRHTRFPWRRDEEPSIYVDSLLDLDKPEPVPRNPGRKKMRLNLTEDD